MKIEPVRMCVGCRKRDSKYRFLRFVERDGRLFFDPDYKASGRGVNICPDPDCFERAFRKNLFERALKTKVELPGSCEELIEEVKKLLKDRIVNAVRIGLKFRGVVLGRDAVEAEARRKRLAVVILAEDLSERSKKDISRLNVKKFELFTKEQWGDFLNRKPVGIIGIVDKGLAKKLSLLIEKYVSLNRRGSLDGKK